jgi:hypothetical protein
MKIHRAMTLVVMMLFGAGLVVIFTAGAIANLDAHSLISLAVVVVLAAISGVAFSWNRYFRRG